jgi:hypothetical protein
LAGLRCIVAAERLRRGRQEQRHRAALQEMLGVAGG